jgi:hypothetical protein
MPIICLFNICIYWYIDISSMQAKNSWNENCTFSTIKWTKSYYLHDQIARKCDAIWPYLETSEWNHPWLSTNFSHNVLGYKTFDVYTDTDDSDIDVKSSSYGDHWPSTVCWGIFGCWWWKICAAREGIHHATGPKGLGGTILPLGTMNHHFATITEVPPKGFQWKLSQNGSSLGRCRKFFSSYVDKMWVWQWGRCVHRCWHRGLSSRRSPIGAILTIGSRHSTRSFC